MKETKLHHQRKFPALGLAITKILCNFTSLKQNISVKVFIRRYLYYTGIGIVPPYRLCNGAIYHMTDMCVLATGKAMPFLFAKVKSQPFNGFIV